MSGHIPNRDEAIELLKKYNKNERLINHALAVEAVMVHFAKLFREDPVKWGVIGLVHDLDYEMAPETHCQKTKEILEGLNWPKDYIRSILSHGWGLCTDVEPQEMMEKVLYAVDELTGLVIATALVRPSKSLHDVKVKSVKKKWKDKSFAAGANREIIEKGATMMERDLNYVIQETINGLRTVADDLGLGGTP